MLRSYNQIGKNDSPLGVKWCAYLETAAPDPWHNNQTYVDTLNKKAIDQFLQLTYKSYKAAVGDSFESDIPSIFTDEPQFSRKTLLASPFQNRGHPGRTQCLLA